MNASRLNGTALCTATILLYTALAAAGAAAAPQDWLVIENGTVIDVEAGTALSGQAVVIKGSKIAAVGKIPETVPGKAHRIDASGKYIIPGLWDMHVHTLWRDDVVDPFFTLSVTYGVTGLRDMGGDPALFRSVVERKLGREGWTPLLYVAGPILDGPKPVHPEISIALQSADDAAGALKKLRQWGMDFAKVYTTLPPETFRAVAKAAKDNMLGLAGHLPWGVTIDEASEAGMRSIEHMVAERDGYCTAGNRAVCSQKFRKLKDYGIFQTPTLVMLNRRSFMDEPGWTYADEFQLAPPPVKAYWAAERERRLAESGPQKTRRRRDFDHDQWMAAEMVRIGVPLLAGTDAGTPYVLPGLSLHEELQRLVTAGLSPAQVLRMATLDAAHFMKLRDSGRIAPGMAADLVILRRNPLKHIRYTGSIEAVIRAGHFHDRTSLDAELKRLRAK